MTARSNVTSRPILSVASAGMLATWRETALIDSAEQTGEMDHLLAAQIVLQPAVLVLAMLSIENMR